jgi:2-amino-4-hydroxy-6-hydroxymethyldihydropteridine diphosphokinase
MGRTAAPRNAPRIIDIDLLSYDQIVIHDEEMDIPHPRMHERTFVLYPLAEVAPAFRHPESGKTVAELMSALANPTQALPLADSVLEADE